MKAKRVNEYDDLYENPYQSAARGYTDEVIMPSDTRKVINRSLDILEGKDRDIIASKVEYIKRHDRKYSNINL
jgi:acetyl-CoA carboxylase carboxyltransferase component